MFDANAAHIREGELFFAEIHAVDNQLESKGLRVGDIILCQHIEKDRENHRANLVSNIWTSKNSKPFEWRACDEFRGKDDWSWMSYSGRPNGNGFISEKWKQKAFEFLGGEWQKDSN